MKIILNRMKKHIESDEKHIKTYKTCEKTFVCSEGKWEIQMARTWPSMGQNLTSRP